MRQESQSPWFANSLRSQGRHDRGSCHVLAAVSQCRRLMRLRDWLIFLSTGSQGTYGGEGDIVVLCAYLGQLARVRDALADKVAVLIDERDQRELLDREAEKDLEDTVTIEEVKVSRRVCHHVLVRFPVVLTRV